MNFPYRSAKAFFVCALTLVGSTAQAFHGGGHGGGFAGGGGGFRGGFSGGGGGFHMPVYRSPSFSMPNMGYNHFNNMNMGNRNFYGGGFNYGNRSYANFNRTYNVNSGYANRAAYGNHMNFNNFGGYNHYNNTYANRFNNVGVNNYNNVGFNRANYTNSRWGNPYSNYHNNWINGYWNGHHGNYWGWNNGNWGWGATGFGLGLGLGYGLGWGLPAWGYGSSYYDWDYTPYYNPYYGQTPVVVQQPIVVGSNPAPISYSAPIDTSSPPPATTVVNNAHGDFDSARVDFKEGDYSKALDEVNKALAATPNDPAMHEFRALVLFATQKYDAAAASLYAVLSVGPGWDWSTMVGLYPNVDVYTKQLREAEAYSNEHPDNAAVRFVLAYQYLTSNFPDAAITELKQVVKLQPKDQLSAQLLAQLTKKGDPKPDSPTEAPAATESANKANEPANTAPPAGATIEGTWTAKSGDNSSIKLTIEPDKNFTWHVDQAGKGHDLTGASTFEDSILTLAQKSGPGLVGHISWKDATHMNFRVVGGSSEDPGLSFSK